MVKERSLHRGEMIKDKRRNPGTPRRKEIDEKSENTGNYDYFPSPLMFAR